MTITPTQATESQRSMVAPGQETLLEEFLQEQGQEPGGQEPPSSLDRFLQEQEPPGGEEAGIPEKFRGKSAAEIANAYVELERKLGQRQAGNEPPAPPVPPAPRAEDYTPELGDQLYGPMVHGFIQAAEINPLEMRDKLQAGEDVTPYVEALVTKGGVAREVVETYLAGVVPPAAPAVTDPKPSELSAADVAALRAQAGGDQAFSQLSQWAVSNLDQGELTAYNAAVDTGNPAVASLALQWLMGRAQGRKEPRLIGGGSPTTTAMSFGSYSDLQEAMNAKDKQGRRRYETDPAYRRAVDQAALRSTLDT